MNALVCFRMLLLILLIVCALAVNLTKNLLRSVIIFMSYSSVMCIVWILLESPDLAITEAAVGAGISGVLFLMTLKRVQAEDAGDDEEEEFEKAFADAARRHTTTEDRDSGWPEAVDAAAVTEPQNSKLEAHADEAPASSARRTQKGQGAKGRKGRRS